MRLPHASASVLLILTNACSTGGDATEPTDKSTTETTSLGNTSLSSGTPTNGTVTTGNSTPQQGTSSTAANTSKTNAEVSPSNTSSNATTSPSRPVTSETGNRTDDETTAEQSDGETDDPTEPDAGDESAQTTESDGSSDTTDAVVMETDADAKFSFFVTSYHHIAELAGSEEGFGGDLRYDGATTGLDGADAICQEIARRVGFGAKTWRAYLSTSTVNAIDRIGTGPWYDFVGALVADAPKDLTSGANRQPGGCCEEGTYDELGLFHNGSTDQNNDGIDDDDHDTMTATLEDGTYAGFSCEDWTSTTATAAGGGGGQMGGGQMGGGGGGIMMGHSWPARSGEHWATSHGGHQCAAGTNFIQNGGGDSSTVGGGGGYGGFYCFALTE